MAQDYFIVRRTADVPPGYEDGTDTASVRVNVAAFPCEPGTTELVLVPDYERGCIQVVSADNLPGSLPGERLQALDVALEEEPDGKSAERLRRVRAASEFRGALSNKKKLTIPPEVAWVLLRDNHNHGLILVVQPDLLEIWPTRRWQNYLAAHLFGDARADIARDTL